jgi:hypothetical protein
VPEGSAFFRKQKKRQPQKENALTGVRAFSSQKQAYYKGNRLVKTQKDYRKPMKGHGLAAIRQTN